MSQHFILQRTTLTGYEEVQAAVYVAEQAQLQTAGEGDGPVDCRGARSRRCRLGLVGRKTSDAAADTMGLHARLQRRRRSRFCQTSPIYKAATVPETHKA